MKALFSVLTVLVLSAVSLSSVANAKSVKGFVAISSQRSLYVDYVEPKAGMPTVILLNGLTYSTLQWERFAQTLLAKGVGVLRYDPYGMGQTLLRYAPVLAVIPIEDQIRDLHALLQTMNIKGPYNLAGLSYGGGLAAGYAAAYPSEINKLIMMAPFTRPLDGQDTWIKAQIWATRQMFPYNQYSDEELYDYFLHQIVYATYPSAEPIVLENPFKLEAVYRLAQGIRHFNTEVLADRLPAGTVHLMVARQDQYIPANVLEDYWSKIPADAKVSRLFVNGSEHKMVEAVPLFTASWVYEILMGNPQISGGKTFEGYPLLGEVDSEDDSVKIKVGE
ncbi:alpha/beta hydrolase [Bdellovibrio sp. NC01]|uniref:alpha/beta hydrolase n=1 Tax=Bdellovibrio sp. NC01 TaxID=2220073 RepID=UPI00115B05B9|nr:alpha/beta hydrolase [Bdellovibrio sp. NC01]QDK36324.1 alpha/beta hydrolase [Bdellovibrio sp. NC01]